MASPYQIAGTRASLADLLQKTQLSGQESNRETSVQMGKMQEEFEAELEAAQAKARKDSKKGSGLFKALNLLSLGLGPMGSAITSGITSGLQGRQQKKSMEKLLSNVSEGKYKNTFLKNPMKAYKQEAEELQMSSGDILRNAFGSALTSFATSKMLGGDTETGGLLKKSRAAREQAGKNVLQNPFKGLFKGEGMQPLIKEGGASYTNALQSSLEKAQKAIESGEFSSVYEAGTSAPLKDIQAGLFKDSSGVNILDRYKPSISGGVSEKALLAKNPGIRQLFESFKDFSGGKISGGTEELQSAMMLPMLLQQILGDK